MKNYRKSTENYKQENCLKIVENRKISNFKVIKNLKMNKKFRKFMKNLLN